MSEIVLGVTGSIAAYKAAELTRSLVKAGHAVSVVMTRAATKFVTPLTFRTLSRRHVAIGIFDPVAEWDPRHVSLARRAEVLVVAPCSADTIAKLANGLADDELSATALACRAPLVIAPAMNDAMYDHPATRANLATLRARGATIVEPAVGELACGSEGRGRLAPLGKILAAIEDALARNAGNRQ